MTATEMHDLIRDAEKALLQNPIWEKGKSHGLENISYCRYCSYSLSHGHGETCVIARLERATGSATAGTP